MDTQDPNLESENLDSPNQEEELDLDLEQAEDQPEAGAEPKKRKLFDEMTQEELLQTVKRQHGQLQKVGKKSPVKPSLVKTPEENIGDSGTRLGKLELAEAKRQYAWENNLSPDETDRIFAITPQPSKKTLEDPFVKAGLEAIRAQRKVNEATPSPSGKFATIEGKPLQEAIKDPKTREKNFEQIRKSIIGK